MPKKEINLLPRDDFERKAIGKFLIWALTVGRWIVVVVELVVILAFLSRFKLDRDIADLYESIRAKQSVIQNNAGFEKDFRQFQSRLVAADTLTKKQLQVVPIVQAVASSLPTEVALTNLAFEEDKVSLTGVSLSENGIKSLVNNLRVSPVLSDISITNIAKQPEMQGAITFKVSAKIKKEEVK